ncbi:hypothetical protein J8J14_15460 [Roseomonas sp. SSH11]|uniref:Uncharacterized protein n=1 Tax=Pararoseomonas baculiformis TaxID=2820812 RepID=A0ABS4AH19_9PROT|nr:hypothetical protein [Pararoseomonas baculiformis]MBP0446171.1 hypothetical protein [Pararoseomonas baculiformis]
MRILTLAAATLLMATPAMANLNDGRTNHRSPGPPIDRGSSRSNTDGAYAGGGMVLEGAPGAPAPMPRQTAPAGSMRPDSPMMQGQGQMMDGQSQMMQGQGRMMQGR